MDRLTGIDFLAHLSGHIHFSQQEAMLAAPTDPGQPLLSEVI